MPYVSQTYYPVHPSDLSPGGYWRTHIPLRHMAPLPQAVTQAFDVNDVRASFDAQQAARDFYVATIGRKVGLDDKKLIPLLKSVYNANALNEFNTAVKQVFETHGIKTNGALDILKQKCISNPFKAFFKKSQYKDMEDYLLKGQNTFRSSVSDYFLHGMWRSVEDFVQVCVAKPLLSIPVIGMVFLMGHVVPFLGGASGVAILAWSMTAGIKSFLNALAIPKMTEEKAEHLRMSGENFSAFAVTMLGYHGIKDSFAAGLKAFRQPITKLSKLKQAERQMYHTSGLFRGVKNHFPSAANAWKNFRLSTTGQVLFSKPGREVPINAGTIQEVVKQFLFISGLLDNVLLPFNSVADNLEQRKQHGHQKKAGK